VRSVGASFRLAAAPPVSAPSGETVYLSFTPANPPVRSTVTPGKALAGGGCEADGEGEGGDGDGDSVEGAGSARSGL
jgi:hypothetical protein